MIWLSVFPTLTVINVVLGDWLVTLPSLLRTLVLTSIAVPIVIYVLMPQLHKVRGRLVGRSGGATSDDRGASPIERRRGGDV